MEGEMRSWTVFARNVGSDRGALVERALAAALQEMARNMTQQIQNTDEAVRRSVQQVAERNNVPAERRNEAMERAFDEAAPRVRLQALEALVERARRDS